MKPHILSTGILALALANTPLSHASAATLDDFSGTTDSDSPNYTYLVGYNGDNQSTDNGFNLSSGYLRPNVPEQEVQIYFYTPIAGPTPMLDAVGDSASINVYLGGGDSRGQAAGLEFSYSTTDLSVSAGILLQAGNGLSTVAFNGGSTSGDVLPGASPGEFITLTATLTSAFTITAVASDASGVLGTDVYTLQASALYNPLYFGPSAYAGGLSNAGGQYAMSDFAYTPAPEVPEPSTNGLLAMGAGMMCFLDLRKFRQNKI